MAFLNNAGLERVWGKITAKLNTKVDKVDGKGLSTNDYTTAEKNKLAGIATGANKTTVDSALSSTSTNPVQNKVVNTAISNLSGLVGDIAVAEQISTANEELSNDALATFMPLAGGTFTGAVYFANGTSYYVDASGNACFAKVYGAVYNDYAEWFPRGEDTEPGDLIALDANSSTERYVKASEENPCVVGVHSNEYAHIIGGDYYDNSEDYFTENLKNYIPVGLAGRCTVKVTGDVKVGDLIVPSSTPGAGRAYIENMDKYDRIVGRVVAVYDDKTAKVILK